MTKKIFFLFLILIGVSDVFAYNTIVRYLSGTGSDNTVKWDFFCTEGRNSGKWTKIKVPSCWELEGFGNYNYGHDNNKANEQGIYKTKFDVPEIWKGKRILIVFEGAMTDTEIKINGKKAGETHQGGYYRFKRDITDRVRYGKKNQLEVTVNKNSANDILNQAERKADFWVFGGIFRPVYLEVVPEHYIDYAAVDARHDGNIAVRVCMSGALHGAEAEVTVLEKDRVVGKITASRMSGDTLFLNGKIDGIKPWTAETPNLYKAVVSVKKDGKVLHEIEEKIGFRTVEVKERDGVYINGVKVRFKGVNRHSFWPETGRTTNKTISVRDAELMKEMNMNAVRMSHYPPDRHFLQVCDSLGLYVIDELCAWQRPAVDTPTGTKLVRELVTRDVNHPSVIFWSNGNEGGHNPELDPLFVLHDPQKRTVLHPYALRGGINTLHYIDYNFGLKYMFNGRDVFMPTELLHGLYDGGHGAGLDDFWNLMLSNPLSAGMFLWDFSDQAVIRTDKNGILDTDKDHGADGILGPHREKEGSFYTIKEIWSPVYVEKRYITPAWTGTINIENRYDFTNIKQCKFSYTLVGIDNLIDGAGKPFSRKIIAPDVQPGNKGVLSLSLPSDWQKYDVLYLKAEDKDGKELYTWSFEIGTPERFVRKALPENIGSASVTDSGNEWILTGGNVEARIDKKNGLLAGVRSGGKVVPLSNGPVFVDKRELVVKSVDLQKEKNGDLKIVAEYTTADRKKRVGTFSWSMSGNGILKLDYHYSIQDWSKLAGITFDFPEKDIKGALLYADGPYRVYNNRMKGVSLNVWEKKYNNTVTGESWEYPEFKGYYSLFHAMKLDCPTPFEVYCATEDIFLHLFTPEIQKGLDAKQNYTNPEYPKGNISFMDAIPAVGTKFGKAELYGPQSQTHRRKSSEIENARLGATLYFRF